MRFSNNGNTKIEKNDGAPSTPVRVGEIVRPHGLKGAVFVHAPQSDKEALSEVDDVLVGRDENDLKSYTLVEADWMPKGWKLTLEGVTTVEAAEGLRGQSVYLSRDDIHTGDNEYLVQDLIGCDVIDRIKGKVGVLDSVEPATMGADRWWVKTPDGDTVPLPAIRTFILSVDTRKKQIQVVDFDQFT